MVQRHTPYLWPMGRFLILFLLLAPAALAGPAGGNFRPYMTALGYWVTASHNAVVQITACGGDLCGRIAGIVLGPGDPVPKDWKGESQCGLRIFDTAPVADAGGTFWRGSILDPRDGSVYHAQIRLQAAGVLLLRGYLGLPIFGQTQIWTAYPGTPGPDCRMAAGLS